MPLQLFSIQLGAFKYGWKLTHNRERERRQGVRRKGGVLLMCAGSGVHLK